MIAYASTYIEQSILYSMFQLISEIFQSILSIGDRMRSSRIFLIGLIFLVFQIIPYLSAWNSISDTHVFGGFLLNPIDGNSYLAKMYQGFSGSWEFVLPYSVDPGKGSFLFIFYLFLGHLARITGISTIICFHLARLISSLILFLTLYKFFLFVFCSEQRKVIRAMLLSSFGSGMGWLISFAGLMTSDFWVAETFPFLSSYVNPHFPLGMAIFLWLLMVSVKADNNKNVIILLVLSILLSWIMPFGVVLAFAILSGKVLVDWMNKQKINWVVPVIILIGGGISIGYQYVITIRDPILSIWNLQNVTTAPPLWDLLISLSPAIMIGFWGIKHLINNHGSPNSKIVLIWLLVGFGLIYFPFNLQRRFMFGIFIPVSILCINGIEVLENRSDRLRKILWPIVFIVSILTNISLLVAGSFAVRSYNPRLVISNGDYIAYQWILESTGETAVILASPETGMFLPAHTGRRVIYGHPFETINAEEEEKMVTRFYEQYLSDTEAIDFVNERKIDYIYFGQNESALGTPQYLNHFDLIYDHNQVKIYDLEGKKN